MAETKYPCTKHQWFDHRATPDQRHYVLCPWCAQEQRKLIYQQHKEEWYVCCIRSRNNVVTES